MNQPHIPARVLREVRLAVAELHDAAQAVHGVRTSPILAHDTKRYVTDVLRNRRRLIVAARETLRRFREVSATKGVDAESVIAGMGGEPTDLPATEDLPPAD